jgi:3-oxoacyl-[acyl-carrier protein] reductase
MDMGIAGRKAIVCGASKGLGKGCAMALAREGVVLVLNARGAEALAKTAAEIKAATGASVTAVATDVTTEAGRSTLLAACPDPDILVTNSGGPPAGDFRNWSGDDWMKALNGNMVTHILLIKAVIDGMIARRFGRIVNITSGAVKSPYPNLGLSNGARAGLTGFVAGARYRNTTSPSTACCLAPTIPTGCAPSSKPAARRGASRRRRRSPRPRRRKPRNGSAPSTSSAPPAPSSAAPMPAISPARTCCSTAAATTARSESGALTGGRAFVGVPAAREQGMDGPEIAGGIGSSGASG